MPRRIANQEIFSAIDRYFNAERAKVEAGRDLAKGLLAWLESQANDQDEFPRRPAEKTTPATIPNNQRELTTQELADIMTVLQPAATNQEQTVSVYKRDKRGKRVKDN